MFKTKRRFAASAIAALLVLVAPSLVPAPALAAGQSCQVAPPLNSAQQRSSLALPAGADFKSYTFNPGVANGSFFYSKVSVAHGYLSQVNLVETNSSIGKSASQPSLASQANALAYINTDYFNEGNGMPYSALIKNGVPIFAPPGLSKVVGTTAFSYSLASGFATSLAFTISKSSFVLSGVNLGAGLGSNSDVVFTPEYKGGQLPKSAAGILVKNGKVAAIYKGWVKTKPTAGALIVATGIDASRYLKFKVGVVTNFKLPAVPVAKTQVHAAFLRLNGSATVGPISLSIKAVNYDNALDGVRLYDSNFTNTRATTAGAYTVALNSQGLVSARYRPGRSVMVPAGGSVLQLGSDGLDLYNASPFGTHVVVKNTFAASHNYKFIHASGSGYQVLASGVNSQDCEAFHEQIRPRTAVGWNNTTGEVWLITTSSGQDLTDFGFRMGGSTVHQVFDWLKMLGATDAVTMDGGGSTTMYIQNGGALKRQDVPDSAWLRDVVVGMALVAKD